jgi:hypothetical protein
VCLDSPRTVGRRLDHPPGERRVVVSGEMGAAERTTGTRRKPGTATETSTSERSVGSRRANSSPLDQSLYV